MVKRILLLAAFSLILFPLATAHAAVTCDKAVNHAAQLPVLQTAPFNKITICRNTNKTIKSITAPGINKDLKFTASKISATAGPVAVASFYNKYSKITYIIKQTATGTWSYTMRP